MVFQGPHGHSPANGLTRCERRAYRVPAVALAPIGLFCRASTGSGVKRLPSITRVRPIRASFIGLHKYGEITIIGMGTDVLKPVEWVGSSRADLKKFPAAVQDQVGFALYQAQAGLKHRDAKPLKGLGANILEVVSRQEGNTYRTVYTVRFKAAVYVLHAFQKKSKRGIATPKQELDLVKQRLKAAQRHYADNYGQG